MKNIMKIITLILAGVAAAIGCAVPTSAAEGIERIIPIYRDGARLDSADGILIGDTTYLPLRAFTEAMGAERISWDNSARTASVERGKTDIQAQEGADYITARDRILYSGRGNRLIEDRIYVPCRPLCKALALNVEWNGENFSINLTEGEEFVSAAEFYNENDLYWLSHIIYAEAGVEPFIGQIAVGNVVLNRIDCDFAPDTIYGVIFDKEYGVQFTPAYSPASAPTIYQTPSESAIRAAKICLEGYSISTDALFFYAPEYVYAAWIEENRPYLFTIGGHKFFG